VKSNLKIEWLIKLSYLRSLEDTGIFGGEVKFYDTKRNLKSEGKYLKRI